MNNEKNPYKDTPEMPSDMQDFTRSASTVTYYDGEVPHCEIPDISIYGRGIYFNSDERFFMRLWHLVSNPFRYLFTGKLRY